MLFRSDVDLVRQVATGWRELQQRHADGGRLADDALKAEVERRLDEMRDALRRTRVQLERVNLGGRKSLTCARASGAWTWTATAASTRGRRTCSPCRGASPARLI